MASGQFSNQFHLLPANYNANIFDQGMHKTFVAHNLCSQIQMQNGLHNCRVPEFEMVYYLRHRK